MTEEVEKGTRRIAGAKDKERNEEHTKNDNH